MYNGYADQNEFHKAMHAAWAERSRRERAFQLESVTCQEDSGSMTGCRPVCDAPATHRVTYDGYRGPYVSLVCKRHADGSAARHYPYSVSVEIL